MNGSELTLCGMDVCIVTTLCFQLERNSYFSIETCVLLLHIIVPFSCPDIVTRLRPFQYVN